MREVVKISSKSQKKRKEKRGFIGLGKTQSIAKSVCEQKKEKSKLLDGNAPVIKLSQNDPKVHCE